MGRTMAENSASSSVETIRIANSPVATATLARWASMAAGLATTGVIPSQPAA